MTRCIICERRPARDGAYCGNCAAKIAAQERQSKPEQPVKFLTYQGHVVGLYRNGNGKLTPRLLKRSADNLPKSKTLDLNTYLEGFTREQIKRFKACVFQLAYA